MALSWMQRKLVNAIFSTGVGSNLIWKDALLQSYWDVMRGTKRKRLVSAVDTSLKVVESIRFLMQSGQNITRTVLLVQNSLVLDMLWGTAFISRNINIAHLKQGAVIPTGSGPAALEQPSNVMAQKNAIKCVQNRIDREQVMLSDSVSKLTTVSELSEA